MRRVAIGNLCAVFVVLCIFVVNGSETNSTTETQRAAELQRENRFTDQNEKQSFEPVVFYKKNCAECHGKDAEKKFEPALPESQLIDAILNGEKLETPPDMPAFAEKGINEERAKTLLAYMKSLRE